MKKWFAEALGNLGENRLQTHLKTHLPFSSGAIHQHHWGWRSSDNYYFIVSRHRKYLL